ncbi:hypothetical protein LG201_13045 [Methylobacillus gramineus]|uniref:hypothetical protein n=1 Tax=Methylobacillus gramineus TaxID=755169 RepID=UPI001CFF908D|nr:hypothetical protein [Methylobacillus gramineus]MCB5186134.1 hypothetical protein [Methylobacillus gramineus]
MAAGWSVLGNCYTTSQQVINAFTGSNYLFFTGANSYFVQPYQVSFTPSTAMLTYRIRFDNNTLDTGVRSLILQTCDTDYTPTPANVVIGEGGIPVVTQPPLTSVTRDTKLSALSPEDVLILCTVFLAALLGLAFGISSGKGVAN